MPEDAGFTLKCKNWFKPTAAIVWFDFPSVRVCVSSRFCSTSTTKAPEIDKEMRENNNQDSMKTDHLWTSLKDLCSINV